MPLHIETPLVESLPLSRIAGGKVLLKLEALQPSGSFKIRGVGHACAHHARLGKRRFISSSGGNAGMAVAYAGRRLGLPVSVFVPETTTERAKHLIRAEGADVTVHGKSWQEANALAQSALDAASAFIHPFDDPLLWTGHGTMIDEAVREGADFDAVVLSVGGGGLMAGVAEGLARNGLAHIPIIAVETAGAASLAAAMRAGETVELPGIASIATSLGARRVADRAFALTQERPVTSLVVSDREAVAACFSFLDDHRLLVEPACGAALAPVYAGAVTATGFTKPLVIVCGGATAAISDLESWRAGFGAAG